MDVIGGVGEVVDRSDLTTRRVSSVAPRVLFAIYTELHTVGVLSLNSTNTQQPGKLWRLSLLA
jgi:hypothetical protein